MERTISNPIILETMKNKGPKGTAKIHRLIKSVFLLRHDHSKSMMKKEHAIPKEIGSPYEPR